MNKTVSLARPLCRLLTLCLLATVTTSSAKAGANNASPYGSNTVVVAASNSTAHDKALARFVCTGSHDELTLQRAAEAIYKNKELKGNGGNVILMAGDYRIDGFPCRGNDCRAAVLLPMIRNNPSVFSLGFRGADHNSQNTRIHVSRACYDTLRTDTKYSVFACEQVGDYCHFSFMDLRMHLPSGGRNIICFDGRQMGSMECRRLMCVVDDHSTWTTPTNEINLPVEGCIALCGCFFNCNSWNYIWESCYALGFGQGYAVGGEHQLLVKCVGAYGRYGFTFNNYYPKGKSSRHENTLIDCTDEANANFMKFAENTGRQTVNILNLNFEYWPQWFALPGQGHFATEVVPGQWYGQVNYTINRGGYTLPNVSDPFWAKGSGINFKSRNNTQKERCTSAERRSYYPTLNQKVFDTDQNKLLICTDPDKPVWVDAMGNEVK